MSIVALPIVFENTAGIIAAHSDGYALVRYHARPRRSNDLRNLLEYLGGFLVDRGWQRILCDARNMKALTLDEQRWMQEQWYPSNVMRPNQLSTVYLSGEDAAVQLLLEEMAPVTQTPPTFSSLQEAQTYLARRS
ncbi:MULTISPECIES: hypothetical protein [Hymenobacter]|uniref:STAS/SEC14 domain-containing protein n=2 Tax=Hymenobacter TaxID=89966 RepID=A0ABS6WUS1_9BACT|nr:MULTISPECIES: hypothetical protein [Hymenobacter]MBO3271667.1 hypothetical protein [Hymenobacter defluvii]MBW3127312.1 hypothetical protein [Hymenobacter profundi]QNE38508.1 hypothetical protein F1C16_02540 [Hymenobacter sp. NBH84]